MSSATTTPIGTTPTTSIERSNNEHRITIDTPQEALTHETPTHHPEWYAHLVNKEGFCRVACALVAAFSMPILYLIFQGSRVYDVYNLQKHDTVLFRSLFLSLHALMTMVLLVLKPIRFGWKDEFGEHLLKILVEVSSSFSTGYLLYLITKPQPTVQSFLDRKLFYCFWIFAIYTIAIAHVVRPGLEIGLTSISLHLSYHCYFEFYKGSELSPLIIAFLVFYGFAVIGLRTWLRTVVNGPGATATARARTRARAITRARTLPMSTEDERNGAARRRRHAVVHDRVLAIV